jgi:GT2 family glycosyltransferase
VVASVLISVICIFKDKDILNDCLLPSLKKQNTAHELILIENQNNRAFSSYAKAMNEGAKRAHGQYLMFVHADICLLHDSCLKDMEKLLQEIPHLGIAGAAGKIDNVVLTNVKHGNPPIPAGEKVIAPTKVQTLDSCLAIVPRNIFTLIHFDEKTFRGWHQVIEDYCLTLGDSGFNVYVLPIDAYHKSTGTVNIGYYTNLLRLLYKHKKKHKIIYTTCGTWNLRLCYRMLFIRLLRELCGREVYFKLMHARCARWANNVVEWLP